MLTLMYDKSFIEPPDAFFFISSVFEVEAYNWEEGGFYN